VLSAFEWNLGVLVPHQARVMRRQCGWEDYSTFAQGLGYEQLSWVDLKDIEAYDRQDRVSVASGEVIEGLLLYSKRNSHGIRNRDFAMAIV
jgi:hypothetical protein